MGSTPSKGDDSLVEPPDGTNRSHEHITDNINNSKDIPNKEDGTQPEIKGVRRSRHDGRSQVDISAASTRVEEPLLPILEHSPNIHIPEVYYTNKLDIDVRPSSQILRDRQERREAEQTRRATEAQQKRESVIIKSERIKTLTSQLTTKLASIIESYKEADLSPNSLRQAHDKMNRVLRWADNRTISLRQDGGLDEELEKARQERSRQHRRLADMAALRVMHESPVLRRLGDPREAEELAERLAAVYDIQWLATYERTKLYYKTKHRRDVSEMELTQCLRDILQYCYIQCQRVAEQQKDTLHQRLLVSLNRTPPQYVSSLILRIKEFQANLIPFYLHRIAKAVKSSISEEPTLSLVIHQRELCFVAPLENYLDMCTEVCWLAQIREPPLHMEFLPVLDGDQYRPYSQPAPRLDYVVWPALMLYKDGPVLRHGVAEFTDTYFYDQHKQVYHFDRKEIKRSDV